MAGSENRRDVTPTQQEAGVTTAPTLSAAEEIAELKAEIARLKAMVDQSDGDSATPQREWPTKITYGEQPYSGARLGGITKRREKIRPSTDFPEVPSPTSDPDQLEADFVRWGYCLVQDAMSPPQVQAQIDRLTDQAEAEKKAGIAHLSHRGCAQTVFNLLPKGQVFRDLICFDESAAQKGPLVEQLVRENPWPRLLPGHGTRIDRSSERWAPGNAPGSGIRSAPPPSLSALQPVDLAVYRFQPGERWNVHRPGIPPRRFGPLPGSAGRGV